MSRFLLASGRATVCETTCSPKEKARGPIGHSKSHAPVPTFLFRDSRLPPAHDPISTPPSTLASLWDEVRFQERPPLPLVRHAQVVAWVAPAPGDRAGAVPDGGGGPLGGGALHPPRARSGTGPRHVLLWSQMHGDEPTATAALFDVFEYFRRHRERSRSCSGCSRRSTLLRGADAQPGRRRALPAPQRAGHRHQPRRAVPADARGAAAQGAARSLQPSLGFNLHNQDWSTAVGEPPKPASISLLAAAFDKARSDNPGRMLAKKVCAVIRDALEPLASGADRPLRRRVRGARLRRQHGALGHAVRADRDRALARRRSRRARCSAELRGAGLRAGGARDGRVEQAEPGALRVDSAE